MLSRRQIITALGGLGALLIAPVTSFSEILTALTDETTARSIADMCAISFTSVRTAMREGHDWVSPTLRRATAQGRIRIQALGSYVEYDGDPYDIIELTVPVVWTLGDEHHNPTANQRIELAGSLIQNAILSAESLIEQRLRDHDLVISRHYRIDKGVTMALPNHQSFYFVVYTALAQLPKGSLCRSS